MAENKIPTPVFSRELMLENPLIAGRELSPPSPVNSKKNASPPSPIFESQFIPLEEAKRQIRLKAGLEESKEVQAPCFVNMVDQFDKHLMLQQLYQGVIESAPPCHTRLKLRIMVAGAKGSGKSELIDTFSCYRFTYRRWQMEGDYRIKNCSMNIGHEQVRVQLIEAPDFSVASEEWAERLRRIVQKGIEVSAEAKHNRLKVANDDSPKKESNSCIHLLFYCLSGEALSPEEAAALQTLDSSVPIIPILCLPAPIDPERAQVIKRKFQNDSLARSVSWFNQYPKDARFLLDTAPLGAPPPFIVVTSNNFVIEKKKQFLARNTGNKIVNVEEKENSDFTALHEIVLDHAGPAAIAIAEKRVDKFLQQKSEKFGLQKGILVGLAIGAAATLALFKKS